MKRFIELRLKDAELPMGVVPKKPTNADRIRSMSDEELKEFICSLLQCKFCEFELWGRCELLKWLQQPAEED